MLTHVYAPDLWDGYVVMDLPRVSRQEELYLEGYSFLDAPKLFVVKQTYLHVTPGGTVQCVQIKTFQGTRKLMSAPS
jgi:hypothetical protein